MFDASKSYRIPVAVLIATLLGGCQSSIHPSQPRQESLMSNAYTTVSAPSPGGIQAHGQRELHAIQDGVGELGWLIRVRSNPVCAGFFGGRPCPATIPIHLIQER
jgi:hypothetical protein